ncbi:hypothetical protein ACFQZF_10920 [Flavobacterium myungsuense]|uniref:Uncharacterized protein n=1 Tax=Flavobacterium myungsuense TaxID=651823 RepID=A0ABW3J200_9FLAO
MKKSIIILGTAFITFSNVSIATPLHTKSQQRIEKYDFIVQHLYVLQ